MKKFKKLSGREYEYMTIIWAHPEGVTSGEIYEKYPDLSMGSKSTIMHRISQKGYVTSRQHGKQVLYFPVISKIEYEQKLLEAKLEAHLGIETIEKLIAAFCGKKDLSKEQADKLKGFIKELENDE